MSRIRSVHPEFFQDRRMATDLTREQRLFYIGLWTEADDEGRFRVSPRNLLGAIWPYEADLSESSVIDSLNALVRTGRLTVYENGGDLFGQLTKFSSYQHPNRPTKSRIPALQAGMRVLTEYSVSPQGGLTERSCEPSPAGVRSWELGVRRTPLPPVGEEEGGVQPDPDQDRVADGAPTSEPTPDLFGHVEQPPTQKTLDDRRVALSWLVDAWNAGPASRGASRANPKLWGEKTVRACEIQVEKSGRETVEAVVRRLRYWDWPGLNPLWLVTTGWEKAVLGQYAVPEEPPAPQQKVWVAPPPDARTPEEISRVADKLDGILARLSEPIGPPRRPHEPFPPEVQSVLDAEQAEWRRP